MPDNVENVEMNAQIDEISSSESEQNVVADCDTADENVDTSPEQNVSPNAEDLAKGLKEIFDKKAQFEQDLNSKKEYLSSILTKYDSDEYFKNEPFKELYKEAFNALGTNLDTEKFINLLEGYVESRINSFSKKLAAQNENESMTDSFAYQNGVSKKSEKKLRMQDIPDDQLEKYIAKYL